MVRLPGGFFVEDKDQGYRANPGRYVFRYIRQRSGTSEHIDTVVTVNADGTRFTGNVPIRPLRNIYVLGDSFVFGDGVNTELSANDRLIRARLDGEDRLVLDTIPMHWPTCRPVSS